MAERTPLFTPTHFLRRRGFYRGVLGGNRGWLTLFLVLAGGRVLRSLIAKSGLPQSKGSGRVSVS
jgi:hypothetical protein